MPRDLTDRRYALGLPSRPQPLLRLDLPHVPRVPLVRPAPGFFELQPGQAVWCWLLGLVIACEASFIAWVLFVR